MQAQTESPWVRTNETCGGGGDPDPEEDDSDTTTG